MSEIYTDIVKDHFFNPRNVGEIPDADGVGTVGNPTCGDVMTIYIKIKDNRISDIKFKTYGCVAAIASTDYLCELVLNKTLEEAEKVTAKDVVNEMGNVPQIKLHCSVLAHDALKKAIEAYREKNSQK